MKVLVIDYGMGNVGSVKRALEECGAVNTVLSNDSRDFADCSHAILPGVGAFPDAMKSLIQFDLVSRIRKLALEDRVPLLGICLGMQLLASTSSEVSLIEGLGLIPGKVEALTPIQKERIPHVGWNEIRIAREDDFLKEVRNNSDFYFVHSYHFVPDNKEYILATTPYCGEFVSIIRKSNVIGTQFHPEKSSTTGFRLLKNFLEL